MRPALVLAAAVALAVAGVATAATAAAQDGDLDIAEANVMGVTWEGSGEQYRFDVTLYHDDAGEDGYADHWQVETFDGERLGRRTLAHPHGTQRFTRSADVTIPDGVETVVVRGHDQIHGYGGHAVLVHVVNGTARSVAQGSEPRDFGDPAEDDGTSDGDDAPDDAADDSADTDATGMETSGDGGPDGTDGATAGAGSDGEDDAPEGEGQPGPAAWLVAATMVLAAAARRRGT